MDAPIDLADALDPQWAGRKAGTLAELLGAGFPVPAGVVIPPAATYDPDDIWDRLDGRTVAVRSSGLTEDGAQSSHAGVFETVLDVADAGTLAVAIETVRQSASSSRAAAYGTPDEPMAVLVQHQVKAITSGVAFTADPGAATGRSWSSVQFGAWAKRWSMALRREIPGASSANGSSPFDAESMISAMPASAKWPHSRDESRWPAGHHKTSNGPGTAPRGGSSKPAP